MEEVLAWSEEWSLHWNIPFQHNFLFLNARAYRCFMSHTPVLYFDLSTDFYLKHSLYSASRWAGRKCWNPLAGAVNYPEKGVSPVMAGTRHFCLFHSLQQDCSAALKTGHKTPSRFRGCQYYFSLPLKH